MAAKTLALNMVMNTDQFRRDVKVAQDAIRDLSTQTEKAKQIAGNFKLAGFDTSQLSNMKSQFETTGKLQDRFFAATHTGLQTTLKKHSDYFSDLRTKWQSNESMLTMINKTETAERTKILADYGKTTKSTLELIRSSMKVGFATYIIKSFMDTGTSMIEAKRKGESMFDAFLAGLPIINRLSESASKLARELSGLAAIEELTAKSGNISEKYNKLYETMSRTVKLSAAGDNKAALQAQFGYEDRLKEIGAIEQEVKAIRDYNKSIDDEISKVQALGKARTEWTTVNGMTMKVQRPGMSSDIMQQQIAELRSKKLVLPNIDALEQLAEKERQSSLSAANIKEAKVETKEVVNVTRDALTQMRSMDYLTRNERIMNLEAYQAANANTLDTVLDANELVNNEIQNLERSRVDAMKVYQAELRDDMQDSALYTSEKWAEAARAIEGSMSNAFQSLISQGASFKDAMKGFLEDVLSSMSRMYSDMAARGLMNIGMNLFTPATTTGTLGSTGAQGAHVFHGGGIAGKDKVPMEIVPSSLFANAPSFHTGSTDMYAKIKRKEGVFTEEQMKSLGPAGGNNINFQPRMKVVIVRNEREAYLEAMNSPEGEKVIVRKVAKNRKVLG